MYQKLNYVANKIPRCLQILFQAWEISLVKIVNSGQT